MTMSARASMYAALAAFALATASVAAQGRAAQAPAQPPAAAAPDFSKVEIKATKIGANFYTLEGQGGAIGVLTGPDGILMVTPSSRHSRTRSWRQSGRSRIARSAS